MRIVYFLLLMSLVTTQALTANYYKEAKKNTYFIMPDDVMRVILCGQKKDIRFVCKQWGSCFLFSGVSLSMSLSKLIRFNIYCDQYKENEFIDNIKNIYTEPMLLANTKSLQSFQGKKDVLDSHFKYLSKLSKLNSYIIHWNNTNTINDDYMKNFAHPHITSLEVHFYKLNNIDFVANFPSLKSLELCGIKFKDQDNNKPFLGLTNILSLKLSNCEINNFTFLSSFTNLNKLYFDYVSNEKEFYNKEDVKAISCLTNLKSLDLSKSNFTGDILLVIEKLTNLEQLTIKCTLIDDDSLEDLKEKLKKLTITNNGNTESSSMDD